MHERRDPITCRSGLQQPWGQATRPRQLCACLIGPLFKLQFDRANRFAKTCPYITLYGAGSKIFRRILSVNCSKSHTFCGSILQFLVIGSLVGTLGCQRQVQPSADSPRYQFFLGTGEAAGSVFRCDRVTGAVDCAVLQIQQRGVWNRILEPSLTNYANSH